MLNGVRKDGSAGADYVEFVTTGAPAKGAFRCSACGYGVMVQSTLPQCPMCNGSTWEREPEPHRPQD